MRAISTRSKVYAAILALLLIIFGIMKLARALNPNIEDSNIAQGDSFSFLFMSDTKIDPTRLDYSSYGELLSKAVDVGDPTLVVFGGDSIFFGGDPLEWREFFKAAGSAFDDRITASVSGDYDSHTLFPGQFDQPKDLEGGLIGYSYSFSLNSVFFVMFDSNTPETASEEKLEWLNKTLQSEAAAQSKWQIVVMHHPMWSVTDDSHDAKRAEFMQEHFLPLMSNAGVDLILCGHQQYYSRTTPLSPGDATNTDGGIVQIMAASGEAGSSKVGNVGYIARSGVAPNFVLLTAFENEIFITAHDYNGEVFDEYLLSK